MALFNYQKQVQRFIRDADQKIINPEDITEYVNRARREVAIRTQSVRVLPPISGSITTVTITNGGAGYVNPQLTITTPDFPSGRGANPNGLQATGTAQQIGGVITNASITNGGSGYWQPIATITDLSGPGLGATATVSTTRVLQTNQGQEVYNLKDIPLEEFPGVGSIYWVRSISILFANYRYSLLTYSFSTYQAQIRNFQNQFQYVPAICAQFGRGTEGSFYLYPISSQPYQIEFDCTCLPIDLIDDQSVEAIPQPWCDLVPFLGAHYAFLEMQNLNAANYYDTLFNRKMADFSAWAQPGKPNNRYGRFSWLMPLLPWAFDVLHHAVLSVC